MDIKATPIARQELLDLGDATYRVVAARLRSEFPQATATDPEVELSELGAVVRVHALRDQGLFVVYHLRDIDGDGSDEIVLLRVVELPAAYSSATRHKGPMAVSWIARRHKSARAGHELLSKIQSLA
jgi:hypothetical protein